MSNQRDVTVRWMGREKVYEGRTGSAAPILLDGDSTEGPSPTEALLMSVAACMAIDVKVILEKGRVTVTGIEVRVEGTRAEDPPRRFESLRLEIIVDGPEEGDLAKMKRAAQLSEDRYCSVFHTLRPDLDVTITTSRA